MTIFGDDEPEDAWDPGDAVGALLTNLVRRTELLIHRRVRTSGTVREALDTLVKLIRRHRRRHPRLSERDRVRAAQLDEDITFLRGRI